MSIDTKIVDRLQSLIRFGEQIRTISNQTTSSRAFDYGPPVDPEAANQWGTSCLSILRRVFGEESDHYKKFSILFPDINYYMRLRKALGVLKAAKDDYENGYLFETRRLIEAEVFDDFLGQAQHLLDNGYYAPAAVVTGSVLEDGLRKLCQLHSISLPAIPKLDSMNTELARKGVYTKLKQKQITSLAHIRNKAAHGEWSEFSEEDVKDMIIQVSSFMTDYLG